MKTLIILLSALSIVAVVWLLYRIFFVRRHSRKKAHDKLNVFQDLLHKLASDASIDEKDVLRLAANPSTRQALFGILKGFNRTDLFPRAYYSIEKSAESFLVNWLEFPTELNAPPDEIEFFTSVTLQEEETFEYLVFRYRKAPPPKGLSDQWIWGVAGPFGPESKPYEIPLRVFSRFNEAGTVSAMEEVRWVHKHINRK